MREILFKAKRLDNGEWAHGFVFWIMYDGVETCCISDEPICGSDYGAIVGCWHMVDPETVCQYTGLTDKKGTKIFEGDIVHYKYEPGKRFWNVDQNCIVSFRGCGFCVDGIMGTNKYACMSGWLSQLPIGDGEFFEVIGNIHDKERTGE